MESKDGAPILVSEYMTMGSLADFFSKTPAHKPAFAPAQSVDLLADCCRGMTYLHGRHPNPVLHRDLKPNNLMVTVGMRLKIGDCAWRSRLRSAQSHPLAQSASPRRSPCATGCRRT